MQQNVKIATRSHVVRGTAGFNVMGISNLYSQFNARMHSHTECGNDKKDKK